ncbi:MAG: phosphotransferase family protein [Desulfarculus sp.]|nr:MAG: phosphotransferase family protein [Desulfarculus sp.]
MQIQDQAAPIRSGEELSRERLAAYLKQAVPELRGELEIEQFPRGFSNLTYLLKVGERQMVLRRPPHGTKAKSAHDMGREFRVLSALQGVFPYCPRPLAFCQDPAVMGCDFYVMERLQGVILRKQLPPGLSFPPEQMGRLCRRLLEVQLELHGIDYQAVGLGDFGKPVGYVERQVLGWSQRYRAAHTPDAPDYEWVMAWLVEHMPLDSVRPAIIHNDFKLDNVVLDPADLTRIVGVLDWEMATIGDPLMDLGNSLAYWVQSDDPPELIQIASVPTYLPGSPSRRELMQLYAQKSGLALEGFDYYYCFGLFRLAVIAQQIYYRFHHGQTKDQRFAALILAVQVLERAARQVIENTSR